MAGIFERFSETAGRFPDLICLQMKEEEGIRKLTYNEVHEKASAVGSCLAQTGISRGDRVAIFAENSPEWCIAYLGIVSIGAVAVPLDAQYTKEEVSNLLRDSESRVIFTSKAILPLVQEASADLKVNIIKLEEPLPENPVLSTLVKGGKERVIGDDDLASLLYTSGTTGAPKGVMLSHGNLLSDADALIKPGLVTHSDHILCILPLHHTYPFMVCFLVPLLVGGKTIFLNSLKGPDILKTIREEGVTVMIGVPQLYSLMRRGILGKIESLRGFKRLISRLLFTVSRELRKITGINPGKIIFRRVHKEFGNTLRFFGSGGARLDPSIAYDMEGLGFTILEGYGLTETSPVATINLLEKKKIGSVGRVIDQVQVKIDNPDKAGVGEVLIKGPNVMKGYYNRPDLTAEVIKDGYFHSGDLGYIDSSGYLFITGRSKEVIVLSSGKNVYPEDVENHYMQSPYIKEICVIGIQDPHHHGSFAGIKALIFPDYEKLAADGIFSVSDHIKWQIEKYSASLPTYKRVSGFSVLKEPLPRTHLGKIRRFMVRDEVVGAGLKPAPTMSDEDQRLIDSDIGKRVFQAISTVTDKDISITSNLELDLGIDSLGRVELITSLETALNVPMPQSFASEAATVKEVIIKAADYAKGKTGIEGMKQTASWNEILMQEPSGEMQKMGIKRRFVSDLTLRFTLWIFYLLCRVLFRLEVRGLENIPTKGACIVTPNHVSFLDGFMVGSVIRKRLPGLFAVGFRGFFNGLLTSMIGRWMHVIVIDADFGLAESLQASAYALKQDVALIIFPEGGRSVDGRLLPFKKGVGILAKELNVPLIPVYIGGAIDVLPRGAWVPKLKKVTLTFGKPLAPDDVQRLDYQKIADGLKERVAELSGKNLE